MKTETTTAHQLWMATLSVFLVKALQTFPRSAALFTATAAPWVMIVAAAFAFLLFWPVAAALAARPGKNLIDLALEAGGRPLAIGLTLALGAFFVAGAGISLRQASELVVTALYPHTPQTVAMTSLLVLSALGAAMRPAGLVWIGALYMWPAVLAITLVLVGNIAWGQLRNATPVAGPGVLPALAEAVPLSSYFAEVAYIAVVASYVSRPQRLVRAGAMALGIAAAIFACVILLYLMVFPLPGGLNVPFPMFELTRLVQGGRFLERLDAFWILLWTYGSAGVTAGALMVTALLFRDAFRLPTHRGAVLPLATAVLAVALLPANQEGTIAVETYLLRRWGVLMAPVLPLLVVLLARLRRGGLRG